MPRYDDRYGATRLYVGHLSHRTRTRDLDDIFSRYGRVRDVDMKRDYAFVEFSDPRDADDARYRLNGREVDGSRIIVEFAKGVPRGAGGSREREYLGRGPAPGTGRCFNCGLDGHWARDCKAGDWKNKCYRCGERGHIEKNCKNSPQKINRGRSYSRTPSPRRGRSRSRSFSRSRSYSRSRSPVKRDRSIEETERRSKRSPPRSKGRKRSPSPDERSPVERESQSPHDREQANGSENSGSPKERSMSPAAADVARDNSSSPADENGRGHSSPSPTPRDDVSPVIGDDESA